MSANNVSRKSSQRMPQIMALEENYFIDNQLTAAYQKTRIEHDNQLNVKSNPKTARLTGIMVTAGECNSHPIAVAELSRAGADIVRLNMSHRDKYWHSVSARSIKEAGDMLKNEFENDILRPISFSMDLPGTEIRTGIFNGDSNSFGSAFLKTGEFVKLLTNDSTKKAGCAFGFWVSCASLPQISHVGDKIAINRGEISLVVSEIGNDSVICKIRKGGVVRDESLVQLVDSFVECPIICDEDEKGVNLAMDLGCDFLISSHVQNSRIIHNIKKIMQKSESCSMRVLAKISSSLGLENFDDILKAADGIVFDRKAVAFDIGEEKLFVAQKSIVSTCRKVGKPVVIGFRPRKENGQWRLSTGDIANAVLDGADSIFIASGLLNAEDTVDIIHKVDAICREAEAARWQRQIFEEFSYLNPIPFDPTQSIALAAVETSMKCNAAAIILTTTTGRCAAMMSVYQPRCPIVAISRHGSVARFLQIFFSVHSLLYRIPPLPDWSKDMDERIQAGMMYLRQRRYIDEGDPIIVVGGWRHCTGFTNCIRIIYASPGQVSQHEEDFEDVW